MVCKRLAHNIACSFLFVPILFALFHIDLLRGTKVPAWDTGDGIAAYKFSQNSIIPRYWNWRENTGHPTWKTLASIRAQDPMMWPILWLLRSSPLSTVQQYNVYVLFRILIVSLSAALIMHALGISVFSRQLVVAVFLFGGMGSLMLRFNGYIAAATGFLYLLYFGIKFFQSGKRRYVYLATLTLLHSSLSYHILYVIPLVLLLGALYCILVSIDWRTQLKRLLAVKGHIFVCLVASLSVLLSFYTYVTQPELVPLLRQISYHNNVNTDGVVQTRGTKQGNSIFNTSLNLSSNQCKKDSCMSFPAKSLGNTIDAKSQRWPAVFLTATVVIFTLIGIFASLTNRQYLAIAIFAFFSLVLSFGHHFYLWSTLMTLLPFLSFIRHTVILFMFFALGVLFLFARFSDKFIQRDQNSKLPLRFLSFVLATILFIHAISAMETPDLRVPLLGAALFLLVQRKLYLPLLLLTISVEVLTFQSVNYGRGKVTLLSATAQKINRPLSTTLKARDYRTPSLQGIPRSQTSTAFGRSSVMESHKQGWHLRATHFGWVTLFSRESYLRDRLYFSRAPETFKRVFGVAPYSLIQFYPIHAIAKEPTSSETVLSEIANGKLLIGDKIGNTTHIKNYLGRTENIETNSFTEFKIDGERLLSEVQISSPTALFLSFPYAIVDKVLVDNVPRKFYRANRFGLAFALKKGIHQIEIIPKSRQKSIVYGLYYGGYFVIFLMMTALGAIKAYGTIVSRNLPLSYPQRVRM